MKFDTGMGVLDLPHDKCAVCIAMDRYMACTACEFKEILTAHARPVVDEMNRRLNGWITQ